jgi:hypothetical protein
MEGWKAERRGRGGSSGIDGWRKVGKRDGGGWRRDSGGFDTQRRNGKNPPESKTNCIII